MEVDQELTVEDARVAKVHHGGVESRLEVTTWRRLLTEIDARLDISDPIKADVRQLQGLSEYEDTDAFLPLSSDELTNPMMPRRVRDFGALAGAIYDELLNQKVVPPGLFTSGFPWRGRFLNVAGVKCFVGFDGKYWLKHGGTPMWLIAYHPVDKPGLEGREDVRRALSSSPESGRPAMVFYCTDGENPPGYTVPLYLPVKAEKEAVAAKVVEQVKEIKERLRQIGASDVTATEALAAEAASGPAAPHGGSPIAPE